MIPENPKERQVSELEFSTLVDELKRDPARAPLLLDLLREDNPIYDQRGSAAAIRMRGWTLLAFEQLGLPRAALLFVLEELDNGREAYLVAAAARSLQSYADPDPTMAPFLVRALHNIQFHDDLVCLDHYGGYILSQDVKKGTTAVDELLMTLRWLGSRAQAAVPEMEALLADNIKGGGALSQVQLRNLRAILGSLSSTTSSLKSVSSQCCTLPMPINGFSEWFIRTRSDDGAIGSVVFEDQDGNHIKFDEFFRGQPSIVVFFYTRCTNPLKCSLTIAKLARLQKLIIDQHLEGKIRTAAITYDPKFDLAERLRGYGDSRGVYVNADNRLLRTISGTDRIRKYFRLGVNFIQSVVNRHRIEVYILDAGGNITASIERVQWDESEVLNCAIALLDRNRSNTTRSLSTSLNKDPLGEKKHSTMLPVTSLPYGASSSHQITGSPFPITLSVLSIVAMLFPKCPVCWATYLSVLGIASLEQLPYSPWLLPLLACLMLINLGTFWLQQRSQRSSVGFYLAAIGAFLILISGISFDLAFLSVIGVILTTMGSVIGVFAFRYPDPFFKDY